MDFKVTDDFAGIDEPAEYDPGARQFVQKYPIMPEARHMRAQAIERAWRDIGKMAGDALREHAATRSKEKLCMTATVELRKRSIYQTPNFGATHEVDARIFVSKTETRHFAELPSLSIKSTLAIEPTASILRELRDRAARPIIQLRDRYCRRPRWWKSMLADIAQYNRVWEGASV